MQNIYFEIFVLYKLSIFLRRRNYRDNNFFELLNLERTVKTSYVDNMGHYVNQ